MEINLTNEQLGYIAVSNAYANLSFHALRDDEAKIDEVKKNFEERMAGLDEELKNNSEYILQLLRNNKRNHRRGLKKHDSLGREKREEFRAYVDKTIIELGASEELRNNSEFMSMVEKIITNENEIITDKNVVLDEVRRISGNLLRAPADRYSELDDEVEKADFEITMEDLSEDLKGDSKFILSLIQEIEASYRAMQRPLKFFDEYHRSEQERTEYRNLMINAVIELGASQQLRDNPEFMKVVERYMGEDSKIINPELSPEALAKNENIIKASEGFVTEVRENGENSLDNSEK